MGKCCSTLQFGGALTPEQNVSNAKNESLVEALRHKLRTTKFRAPLVWFRHQCVRPNDVFLASFHRSGNTWMRFLLCEILANHAADFKTVGFAVPDLGLAGKGWKLLKDGGRLIRTHEPYYGVYRKAIYFVRDPRDVAVSCFEFYRTGQTMDDFLHSWITGKTSAHGTWHHHISSWLDSPLASNGNLLVIHYERMRADIGHTLTEVLRFLDAPVDSLVVKRAIANNNLEKMRAKEAVARVTGEGFAGQRIRNRGLRIRVGTVGQWQGRLTESQVQLIEEHAGGLLTRLGYAPQREMNQVSHDESHPEPLMSEAGEASA
jgi:hypothetical protein